MVNQPPEIKNNPEVNQWVLEDKKALNLDVDMKENKK